MIYEKNIINLLKKKDYSPSVLKELYVIFGIKNKDEKKDFRDTLKFLMKSGKIAKDGYNRYYIPVTSFPVGKLEFVRKGNMAFVKANDSNEYVVFLENCKNAMHRDLVSLKPKGTYREWQRAEVVKVIKRNMSEVVGVLIKEGKKYFVLPDEKRVGYRFYVKTTSQKSLKGARPGEKVLAKITSYPSRNTPPKISIEKVLGKIENPKIHLPSVIVKHALPFPDEFPDAVEKELESIPKRVLKKEMQERKDYRDKLVVTIDGKDAKDFDDAVSLEKLENGNYKLYVLIADVANYVKTDSPLDQEAFSRGTSVYLINTVIPMLPFPLSNGLCSLKEGVNRLVMALEMELDKAGNLLNYEVKEGVMKSSRRLTYSLVNEWLEFNKQSAFKKLNRTPGLVEMLELMHELSDIIKESRRKRGAIINIESGEVKIVVDENGNTVDIIPRQRHVSESIIEEFMIKANEAVAEIFHNADLPFVYRIHEEPEYDTLEQLKKYIFTLGIEKELPRRMTSSKIQVLLESLSNHPLKNSVERLIVRTMKRAVYSNYNDGHYGLASEAYTHFTSPIRRYPDLVVHRILKEYISGKSFEKKTLEKWEKELPYICINCTQRERIANEAEWDLIALKKVDYIAKNSSEIFDVVVTNVSKFGLFVEIPEKLIPGLIHVSSLSDYFIYDEDRNVLVGERTGKTYKLGDTLKVRVKDIDFVRGEIDFEIVHW